MGTPEALFSENMELFRSYIQTITHNLPQPIRDLGVSLIGKTCYNSLLLELDMESKECLKLAISKGLGIGIITTSSVVKVPQILKLIKSRSAAGLSFLSYLLETFSYLISMAYNIRHGFPLSTFGEIGLILLQNVLIAALILHYNGKIMLAACFIAGLASSIYMLFNPAIVDFKVLNYLQTSAGTLGIISKLPQIIDIWREGGTGQLSAFAASLSPFFHLLTKLTFQVFNFLVGSLARVFTTFQEIDDKLVLYNYIAGFCLNAIVAIQMIYYWNSSGHRSRIMKEKISAPASKPLNIQKKRVSSSRRRG